MPDYPPYRGPFSGKSKGGNGSQLQPIVPNIPHKVVPGSGSKPYFEPGPGRTRVLPLPKARTKAQQKYARTNGRSWLSSWKV